MPNRSHSLPSVAAFLALATAFVTQVGCGLTRQTLLHVSGDSVTSQVQQASFRDETGLGTAVEVSRFTSAPLQIDKQVVLNAPVDEVFAYVGRLEAMADWMPMMREVTVDNSASQNGPGHVGVGSVRTCVIFPNDVVSETIVAWVPNRAYAYKVIDRQKGVPFDNGFGLVTFEPTTNGAATTMRWRIYFDPHHLNPKAHLMSPMVKAMIGSGMENLAEHFAEPNGATGHVF